MCARAGMRERREAFTLIEVLVVVAIIAMLIAILLPALSSARDQAKRAKCLANLHTLGQGMIMYAGSFQDKLPNGNAPSAADDPAGATRVLVHLAERYVRNPGSFYCPSDRDPAPVAITTADYLVPNSARTSYDFYSVWWIPAYGPRLTQIKRAPMSWDLHGGAPKPDSFQNHGNRGGNVVYADGHADWQPVKRWDKENWPYPASQFYEPQ